jgi:cation diffusion facilitator CzcD-associated flavoprotein CzcO
VPELPNACVIGAGCSGITATKALAAAGIEVDCFERSDHVGGLWAYREGDDKTAAYRSLHINTSRRRMEFADYPMPDGPDFPGHRQIAEYFNAYADKFGVRDRIRFRTEVARATRGGDGVWNVELTGGERRRYAALIVANGHHWKPQWPDPPFPGAFDGTIMHSHAFVDAQPLAGKRVLVLGMGNSAMDIAVEASYQAEQVFLAARRGAHVVPKYVFGRPIDTLGTNARIPRAIRLGMLRAMLRLVQGPVERYGLPRPDHRLGEAHPTVSSDILNRMAHGTVVARPNIAELRGDSVKFSDGTVERVDVIVYCTGYQVTFPFFDETFLTASDNDLPLFRRVFKPGIPNLAFIGLLQPLGPIMPLAEAQGLWVADYLTGRYALPPDDEMLRDIAREREQMFARYVKSRRHTMQVDFDDYLLALTKERRRGERRARRRGNLVPVPALATATGPRVIAASSPSPPQSS